MRILIADDSGGLPEALQGLFQRVPGAAASVRPA
jgi:hypothetical protein